MKNYKLVLGCTGALFMLACPENFLLNDVSFDLWCGNKLCTWQVDEGEVRKVATWHEKDTAVELIGTPAQISQYSEAEGVGCIRFELIANVEASTRTSVRLDFNDDGTIDFEQVVPTQAWQPVEYLIRTPANYEGIRFSLRKSGPGRAIIAQMGAVEEFGCEGEVVQLKPQREGAACERDAECLDGQCVEQHCSTCAVDGICEGDAPCEVDAHCASGACVRTDEDQHACSACAGAGACEEGAECRIDAHCDEGACAAGHCSRCAMEGSCGGGASCDVDEQCASGDCWEGVCTECTHDTQCNDGAQCVQGFCSECASDDECTADQVCAFSQAEDKWPHTCQSVREPNSVFVGQRCLADAECVGDHRCGSVDAQLPQRCGITCIEEGEPCEGGGTCREVLTHITEELEVQTAWVCATDADCGKSAICIDP